MAQDPNQQSSYGSGYGGYAPPPKSASGGQSTYSQPDAYQQSSQPGGSQQYSSGQQQQYGSYQKQQYGGYQPPLSATTGRSAHDPTSTGLNARTEALASYFFIWLGGIVFFLIERKNRFVRFHAAQSFVFFGSVAVVYYVLQLLIHFISIIPLLGGVLGGLLSLILGVISIPVGLALVLVWLFLMVQAYRGKTVRLPFFSGYADSLLNRFSPKQKTTI